MFSFKEFRNSNKKEFNTIKFMALKKYILRDNLLT